jgi:inhibitor of cysteine peptidase
MILLFMVSLAACHSSNTGQASPLQVNESHNKLALAVQVEQSIEIQLPGNPATGYEWKTVSIDPPILKFETKEFRPATNAMGSGGTVLLRYTALQKGSALLKLIYHRAWEKETPPRKSFELSITVIGE